MLSLPQAVEEEQERVGDCQHQQRKDIQQLQQQQQQSRGAPPAEPASQGLVAARVASGRQRVSGASVSTAAAPSRDSHTDGGAVCALPAGFALPDMACMLPSSISEPDSPQLTGRDSASALYPRSNNLQQQPSQLSQSSADVGEAPGQGTAAFQGSQQLQLADDLDVLAGRLRLLEEQQVQAGDEVTRRLNALEQQHAGDAPLDAMTCGAVEARLSVLEDENSEAKQQLQVGMHVDSGAACCVVYKDKARDDIESCFTQQQLHVYVQARGFRGQREWRLTPAATWARS